MNKKQKIARDKKTIKNYEKQLRAKRKEHCNGMQVYSMSDRKSRAMALGECTLRALEDFKELQAEQLKKKMPLVNGTLWWAIEQNKVKDTDGKKGYEYKVMYSVKSQEPFYTEEEIRQELKDTYRKLKAETEEMFGETTDEEYLEEQ